MAAADNDFSINFAEAATYETFEGVGGGALLKKNGLYAGVITKMVPKKAPDGKGMFYVVCTVTDEDEKGQQIGGNVLCTGIDRNGKPLSRQFFALLESATGMTQAQVQAMASKGMQPKDALIEALTGKPVFMQVEAELYDGKETSKIQNFIIGSRYTEAVKVGSHRTERQAIGSYAQTSPAAAAAPKASAGAALLGLTGGNGVIPAAGPAIDPLARVASLGLKL